MMYIVRMTNGDCVAAMAADERGARCIAMKLRLDETAEVASIRRIDSFAVQFTPTEDGSLEATHWDDATLDGILANEYPLLRKAFQRANAEPLLPKRDSTEPAMERLHSAYERNLDGIREGLRQELQRSGTPQFVGKSKAAHRR